MLVRSLARAVLINERIITTHIKAKAASSAVDRLITLGKDNSLHARRIAYAFLQDHELVQRLFDALAPRFKARNGGYTRVVKMGVFRKGDGAPLSLVEFSDYRLKEKEKKIKNAGEKEKKVPEAETVAEPVPAPIGPSPEKPQKAARGLKKIFKKKEAKQVTGNKSQVTGQDSKT